ncbi:MAG: hypothetical protein QXR53_05135 [Candidatus Norongarragalinales archaeon]
MKKVIFVDADAIQSAMDYAEGEMQRFQRIAKKTTERISSVIGRRVAAVELVHNSNLLREIADAIAPTMPAGGRRQAAELAAKQMFALFPKSVLNQNVEEFLSPDGQEFVFEIPKAYVDLVRRRFTITQGTRRAAIAEAGEQLVRGLNALRDAGVGFSVTAAASFVPVEFKNGRFVLSLKRICVAFQSAADL